MLLATIITLAVSTLARAVEDVASLVQRELAAETRGDVAAALTSMSAEEHGSGEVERVGFARIGEGTRDLVTCDIAGQRKRFARATSATRPDHREGRATSRIATERAGDPECAVLARDERAARELPPP